MVPKRKAEQQLDSSSTTTKNQHGLKRRMISRTAGEQLIDHANSLPALDFQNAYVPDDILSHSIHRPLDTADDLHKDDTVQTTFHHAHQLKPTQLVTCFDLIDLTSRKDYENSTLGWHPRRKRREMQDDDMRYLLLRDRGGAIQGFLSFMLTHDSTPAVPVLYIYEIHLQNHLQRKGLGTYLMGAAEAIASRVGVEKVMLTCFLSNLRARKFYERRGYMADVCSPGPRLMRSKVVEPDYVIMSKDIEH